MGAMFLFGIQVSCQMTFNALGKAVESIVVAVMRKFVLLLPLIYIMPRTFFFRSDNGRLYGRTHCGCDRSNFYSNTLFYTV